MRAIITFVVACCALGTGASCMSAPRPYSAGGPADPNAPATPLAPASSTLALGAPDAGTPPESAPVPGMPMGGTELDGGMNMPGMNMGGMNMGGMNTGGMNMGSDGSAPKEEQAPAQEEKGLTEYTCVMHPEVRSSKPGRCPKCGMKLVPRRNGDDGAKK